MNYLAHFHLSDGEADWQLGALLGDFAKGRLKGHYPKGIEQGIWLHRQIDAYTDRHPIIRDLLARFSPEYRRFGNIMLDVSFDYFLTTHWPHFHPQPLGKFNQQLYQQLQSYQWPLPAAARLAERMVQYDILGNYQNWKGVENALVHISGRFRRANPLAEAADELDKHQQAIEQSFLNFYPELHTHCEQLKLQQLKPQLDDANAAPQKS